ncbi:hypothetical protein IHE44_0003848, partial [Lamprotornis superbus]
MGVPNAKPITKKKKGEKEKKIEKRSVCEVAALGQWVTGAAESLVQQEGGMHEGSPVPAGLCQHESYRSTLLPLYPALCLRPPEWGRSSLPASPTWTPRLARRPGSLDGWASPASVPELDEGTPMSPPWSERSLSPLLQDADPRASRQMQARLARNIINAARRKSSSPKAVGLESSRPFTPISAGPPSLPQSPRLGPRAPALQAASSLLGSLGSPSPTHKSPLRSPRAGSPQF